MALLDRRLPANVDGDFYVDDSCIDCGTCYWVAPDTFERAAGMSRVFAQPEDDARTHRAEMAILSCPTSSIGSVSKRPLAAAVASFPDRIDGEVYHAGYHSEKSFGATSYLVRRPEGNVLVDSPRFTRPLVRRLEEMGGVSTLFLTHRDDVADHTKFAQHFGATRVIHTDDVTSATRAVERVIVGAEPVPLAEDLLVIPTPGHTKGSACLLVGGRYLFTGDHLAFSERLGHVYAFASACWYDWDTQIESMERLATHDFEWILPGHGVRCHFDAEQMRAEMRRCIEWMRTH